MKTLKDKLAFSIYSIDGIDKEDYECKLFNINSFLNINREGLKNGVLEKRLIMYKTQFNEVIYIEYPGKESTKAYESLETKNILNPNDFRPELQCSQ